nr:glycosyltransferase family 39 protein [Frigidibacter sp. ROC022]
MIAWVIGGFTAVCGDSPFCIRLPAPIFHGATALILGAVAAQLSGRRAALLVVAAWLTLPMVALASLLISTDTILFPFMALALWAYLACLRGAGPGVALLGGLALGLGFLSKYAAVYYLLCALLALGLRPRLDLRQAAGFLLGFVLAASPNILWNLGNGLTTVQHTLDNADWVRDPGAKASLNLAGLSEFFFSQFAVFGPVLFGTLLWLGAGWRNRPAELRRLLWFALPIVALVCGQALLSRAYANWAATAYLAGTLAVIPWLARNARAWLRVSFAVNMVFCLAFPLATVFADRLVVNGQPLLNRYLGRAEISRQIIAEARKQGLTTVVAEDRDILADLFYTGRDSGLDFRAVPSRGRAPHHYALRYPLDPAGTETVLWVAPADAVPRCDSSIPVGRLAPETGAYRNKPMQLYVTTPDCLCSPVPAPG